MALDFIASLKLVLELMAFLISLGLVLDSHAFLMRCLKERIPKAMPARYLFIAFSFLSSALLFELLDSIFSGEVREVFSILSVVMLVLFAGFYVVSVSDLYIRGLKGNGGEEQ